MQFRPTMSTDENIASAGKLAGRTAIVTGAGRGIGRACALRLATLGADVAIVDIDLQSFRTYELEAEQMAGASTADEIEQLGRRVLSFERDLTDPHSMTDVVANVLQEWGRVDVAACIAGGGSGTFDETRASIVDDEALDLVISRNLNATIYTCKAVAEPMRQQRFGRIITMSSKSGRLPDKAGGYAHYGAAKAGIAMYSQYLAQELGPYGINVNCLAPGYIRTGRLAPVFDTLGNDALLDTVALRRFGTPEEIAGVVEFLSTDLGSYVSGVVLPIDGGSI